MTLCIEITFSLLKKNLKVSKTPLKIINLVLGDKRN